MRDLASLRLALVGPLPPPSGGMANQTAQLARFLGREGASVRVVRTNAPYRPRLVARVRGLRALFRLVPYGLALRRAARDVALFHVMANSGRAWHLFAAPALVAAHRAGVPAVLNYRGGDAERFFARSFSRVQRTLSLASAVVVPSKFLQDVFARCGVAAEIVPNIVDLERFRPSEKLPGNGRGPRILIARNLEPIYDVETGLRAFHRLRERAPAAELRVAGSGPERARLERLAEDLGLGDSVRFLGRIDNEEMPGHYRSADVALNTSRVDNMPISILEALASGVPVVSTRVGGVPAVVEEGKEAVLVPAGDAEAMADALVRLWQEPGRRDELRRAGLERARQYGWEAVRAQWTRVYEAVR